MSGSPPNWPHSPKKAPQIKIIDATTIDLCAAVFPWAKFRTRKGAIKLHTVLNGVLPQCVLVTDGKTHDLQAVQDLRFKAGDLLIFDRAYLDYAWLYQLHQDTVWFCDPAKKQLLLRGYPGKSRLLPRSWPIR